MAYYLSGFFFTLVFCWLADKYNRKNKQGPLVLCLIIACIILSALAGIRDDCIGTDIMYYAKSCFQRAQGYSSVIDFFNSTVIDKGYALLAYVISRFTNELGVMLFFSQFLVVAPVFASAYIKRNETSFTLVGFVYCFWFFCFSLNIMRQSISCAFLLLAAALYEQNKTINKWVILICMFACTFHISALFGCLVYILCRYATSGKQMSSFLKKGIVFLGVIISMVGFSYILTLLAKFGLIPQKYIRSMSYSFTAQEFSLVEFCLRGVILFFPIVATMIVKRKVPEKLHFVNYLIVIGYVLSFGKGISTYLTRLVYYCNYFALLSIPLNICCLQKNNRRIVFCIEILLLFIYWYQIYIYMGWHEVYPFVTRF